jgi:hypothetical protein
MASFGSFETDREVYSEPSYTVFSAKKAGDPKAEEYAIKVFSLHQLELGAETTTDLEPLVSDLERACVNRIAVQQKAASASAYVSPILETGKDDRGVWYATKFYPRSVNKIISGRVALNREALHHIIHCIAQGALDFKRSCGRSHGDIRPSNIQISRSQKLSDAEVVLSDPLPGGEAEATIYELSDLKAIGQILVQLVMQRELTDGAGWLILPILASPDWTRLFLKDTDRWLALCNRLLDPHLALDQITLEQLIAELEQLQPKPPVSGRVIVAAVVLLVLLGVGTFFLLRRSNEGRLELASDPPGAEIKLEVEGQVQSRGRTPLDQPSLLLTLPKGNYKGWAEYPGLPGQTNDLIVEGGKTRKYEFLFPYGRVQISSTPTNAAVELDGKAVGFTPYTSPALAPGPQVYFLRLTNHQPAKISVLVSSNRQVVSKEMNLIRMKADDGVVEFRSVPDHAMLKEGTTKLQEEPTPFFKTLPAGRHTITAELEDWPPLTREIEVVRGENPPVDFYFPHGIAEFNVTPEGAEILVNDKPFGPRRQKRLPPSDHYTVLVTNLGYYSFSTNIAVTESNVTRLSVSLKPMLGIVEFTSKPTGAAIFEAKAPDKELGRTQAGRPLSKTFPPGSYSFIARFEGLDEVRSKPVEVAMGSTIPLELRFSYGTVQFDTEPGGADVLIGGRKMTTPYVHLQKPGPVTYRVELADYYPEAGTKELSPGAIIPLSFRLRPKDVSVVLRSVPSGAQYYMAEILLSGTNEIYTLPWGPHTITARYPSLPGLPGLEPMTNSVEVDKNGTTTRKFEFNFATLDITNAEPEAKLLYQNQPITNLPARLFLKPDFQYKFELEYGTDFRTNLLPITLAAGKSFTPAITLPELRRIYTNSINMVLIRVNKNLYAGKFEVTEAEYRRVLGGALIGKPQQPVVDIKWADAVKFCDTLSGTDQEVLGRNKLPGWKYSLPTEAEWSSFAEPTAAVLDGSLFNRSLLQVPAEIDPGRKSASALGIYDLFGNAAEWCSGADNQPITMGGSVANAKPRPEDALAKLRAGNLPADTIASGSPIIGFRCVLKRPSQ